MGGKKKKKKRVMYSGFMRAAASLYNWKVTTEWDLFGLKS